MASEKVPKNIIEIRIVEPDEYPAVKYCQDIAARGEMLVASSMGATAFQKGLGVNHSIAHALGVFYDTHHGLANAAVLVEVMKYNIDDIRFFNSGDLKFLNQF